MNTPDPISPYRDLTPAQFEAIGQRFDAIRNRVRGELGRRDADYIHALVRRQRQLEVGGRVLMILPPTWPLGVAALSAAKILDNMEIGHNVMHGQYDWMHDPAINSKSFEWDTADTAKNWKKTHNFEHHTFTNVVGRDHDVGYGLLRMSEDQPWEPRFLFNVPLAVVLHTFFQHFVAVQNMKLEDFLIYKTKTREQLAAEFKPVWNKMRKQLARDYLWFPLLAGPFAPLVLVGNVVANFTRNVWACAVIFNGHFPEQAEQFPESVLQNETRGQWYVRQLLGSANFSGGKLMHIASGNLSFQVEHHLFPDLPAHRYHEISPEVQAICHDYGLPYNTGSFWKQTASTWTRILRLSFPTGKRREATPVNGGTGGAQTPSLPLAA
ncbi:MAG: acyl-CoA desaturase [Nevskiaceae bacterium]|nr:MAG: acyl-CoA desaturase [Nevskiaceae bacterium]TBR71519.1 MAG: acyl-CoA desaturase [Nevskiaceae bacterium]